MPGACPILWRTDSCDWSVWDSWRWTDLVGRTIYIGLALMLVYTFFVVVRFLFRYRVARHTFRELKLEPGADSPRSERALIADLSRGLKILRGIAYAAPFLALAGTSYAILLPYIWFPRQFSQGVAETLACTVLGILVAISATVSYNLLTICVESLSEALRSRWNSRGTNLGSSQFAQTLPLKRRISGLPHLPLIAVPFLSCVLTTYFWFRPYPMTVGLPVRVLPIGSSERGSDEAGKVIITLLSKVNDAPMVRVNPKEVPWDKLEEAVQEKFHDTSDPQAFVEADSEVSWAYVTDVVNTLRRHHCRVILLTTSPARKAKQRNPCRFKVPQSCGSVN